MTSQDSDAIDVDGIAIWFQPESDGLRVDVQSASGGLRPLGRLRTAPNGESYSAALASGTVLTRPSPWGGPVTARFQSRELAVRALLDAEGSANR